jgi:hypothetical protein
MAPMSWPRMSYGWLASSGKGAVKILPTMSSRAGRPRDSSSLSAPTALFSDRKTFTNLFMGLQRAFNSGDEGWEHWKGKALEKWNGDELLQGLLELEQNEECKVVTFSLWFVSLSFHGILLNKRGGVSPSPSLGC